MDMSSSHQSGQGTLQTAAWRLFMASSGVRPLGCEVFALNVRKNLDQASMKINHSDILVYISKNKYLFKFYQV